MKKLLAAALFAPLMALAQGYPSPTFQNVTVLGTMTNANAAITGGSISGISPPIPVASGGTNSASASGTTLDNITGFSGTGFLTRMGAGSYAFQMPPTCSSSSQALQWNGSSFTCNSSILANNVSGTIPVANGGTGLTSLGAGVTSGLGTAVNSGSGFVTYSQHALSGAGITPYAYGAAGNGSSDDSTAVQNWLNAAASAGQVAFCSAGDYKITRTINLTAQALKITGPGGTGCALISSLPTGPTVSGTAAGASYGGATSIRLTVSSAANVGTSVEVQNVGGTIEANGAWPSVVVDATHIDIVGPTFAHTYSSGGQVYLPLLSVVPASNPNSAAQPTLEMSGVYFAQPAANAATTDAIIITGGAFASSGSNVNIYNNIINGYHRGMQLYQSPSPQISYNYFYNNLGAGLAGIDGSFSNALISHNQFFSNGNTVGEAALTTSLGPFWVESPAFIANQMSGNWAGLNFNGNVNGALVDGNYLENNAQYNFDCTVSATNNGAHVVGNWFAQTTGTITTALNNCTGMFFANNWLSNQVFNLGKNSVNMAATNTLSGTAAIQSPATPSIEMNGALVKLYGDTSNQAAMYTYSNSGTLTWAIGQSASASPGFFIYNNSLSDNAITIPLATDIVQVSRGVSIPRYPVSGLPPCNSSYQGVVVGVTDAVSPTYNGTLTGGGGTTTLAYCNGATWNAH